MGARAEGVGWDAVRGGMLLDSKKRHLKAQRICNHLPLYLSVLYENNIATSPAVPMLRPPNTRNCQFLVLTPLRKQAQSTHDIMCGEVSGVAKFRDKWLATFTCVCINVGCLRCPIMSEHEMRMPMSINKRTARAAHLSCRKISRSQTPPAQQGRQRQQSRSVPPK